MNKRNRNIIIYYKPKSQHNFSLNEEFISFGNGCEKTLEKFEKGESLIVCNKEDIINLLTKDMETAVLFSQGKTILSGRKSDVIKKYYDFLAERKENENLITKNRKILEKIKKSNERVEIKDVRFLNEKNEECYLFPKNSRIKAIIKFDTKNKVSIFKIIFYDALPLNTIGQKSFEWISKKINDGHAFFDDNNFGLTPGKYYFLIEVMDQGKNIIRYNDIFDLKISRNRWK